MMQKGQTWNESTIYQDPVTLRTVRRVTSQGYLNTVPSYHTDQAFTRDGRYVIFITNREGRSALCKADVQTGDITCLTRPIRGLGAPNEVHQYGDGKGISIGAVLEPRGHWAFYAAGRSLRAVHIDTLQERVVVPQIPRHMYIESMVVSCDEQYLLYALVGLYPQDTEAMRYEIRRIRLWDGESETLLEGNGYNISHLMQNPVYPHLFLVGKDKGPSPLHRIDENSRAWIWNTDTGSMTNVKTLADQNFQTHTAWTWDGEGVLYHGMLGNSSWPGNLNDKGWYIGLSSLDGQPIREYSFPDAPYYGHVSAMRGKNAAILDGNLMDGYLMWLYFDEETPRVEIIARHDTDFTLMPGQSTHPHTICAPGGHHLVFNSARRVIFSGGRSDIYAVEV
ncbi:MAG: hypothetical protein IJ157_13945 [Clostridia bacterium]|nr:hypothetical protein [Clostridia bacterium]